MCAFKKITGTSDARLLLKALEDISTLSYPGHIKDYFEAITSRATSRELRWYLSSTSRTMG